ncbi:hypothetical protein [Poseidonibacter lekithochrous]|uniref:hypothetical protein n=1 Tax=Poseidonibacter lekithochrous TaxID=1904463 RepID=UPI000D3CAF9D|nr:hypothetical protein [Poseidonibacter lekithochrous]
MNNILKYKSFFAYSEKTNKSFFTEFKNGINIVYGRNTSGKSTLIQAILYTFGINDVKTPLKDILDEKPIFRLDCELLIKNNIINLTLIRDDETIYIKQDKKAIKSFFGIGGNGSEHSKLKLFLHELFDFNLQLEQKGSIVKASIETMFLPYYIAQSTGWVYLRKSFSGLEYYKNFKYDYLDYYLGIENEMDREEKHKLEKEKLSFENEIKFLNEFETTNEKLTITKMLDENFISEANNYIEKFKEKEEELRIKESEYISKCNKLGFYSTRIKILNKVKRNHKKQNPEKDNCPVCQNKLNYSTESIYEYHQDLNDTENQLAEIKEKQKKLQGKINTLKNSIEELKEKISKEFQIVKKYEQEQITFEKWLNNKSNTRLIQNIELKLSKLSNDLQDRKGELEKYKTDDELQEIRKDLDSKFSKLFQRYLKELDVTSKSVYDYKYTTLYKSSVFPLQGVELHKAVLAHNFAFNKMINDNNKNSHRLPFLIDAIFKEDIDKPNKKTILNFVYKNKPLDTQIIISIAYKDDEDDSIIDEYNKNNFNNQANLICIGNAVKTHAFLSESDSKYEDILEETLSIIDNT